MEDGVHIHAGKDENALVAASIVGNLAVLKQLTDLDYEGLVSFLEEV